MPSPWNNLKMYGRYALGLPDFLLKPISFEDAERMIREGMEQREANFLRLMERGVYPRPQSPYARLLAMAQCELGDLRRLVHQRGLTAALRQLREAGVYIAFEEFKGRQPVVRPGLEFSVRTADFANPLPGRGYEGESGGSTGQGTRIRHDLDHLHMQSAHLMMMFHAQGKLNVPFAVWRGVLPDCSGLDNVMREAHRGRLLRRWFVPRGKHERLPEFRFQLATYGTVITGRMLGVQLPWPEMVPLNEAITVARWMAETIQREGACVLGAPVSRALRVSIAAQEAKLDLTGGCFLIAGEPPSPAKVKGIQACGASFFTNYGFTEGGRVAIGCANPASENDLHILRDAFEIIPFERPVPGTDRMVPALNATSLMLATPQILLNAEMDDYGLVEDRRCGCPLERLGYHQHLSGVHSFRKLTGEGVTLVGSDLLDIIERVLPERFGGSALDYQLMEEEDAQGFTRLSLIVSPRVQIGSEDELVQIILRELHRANVMAGRAQAIWAQAGTIQVKRQEPFVTGRGKLLPLHLVRQPAAGKGVR